MATFESLEIQYSDFMPVTLDAWGSCERVHGLIGPQWNGFERVYLDRENVEAAIELTNGSEDGWMHFEDDVLFAGELGEMHPVPTVQIGSGTYWDFGGWMFERWHGHDYKGHVSRLAGTFSHVCQKCGHVVIGPEEIDLSDPWEV